MYSNLVVNLVMYAFSTFLTYFKVCISIDALEFRELDAAHRLTALAKHQFPIEHRNFL